MDLSTASEARQWRRCSLAAAGVLLFSLAGEHVVSAVAPDERAAEKRCIYSSPNVPHTAVFRMLEHFAGLVAR
jgi:hypothetical protein